MDGSHQHPTGSIDPRTFFDDLDHGGETAPEASEASADIIDPREFFDRLVHRLGDRAKPEYLAFRAGDVILRQGEHVRSLLLMRYGEVGLSIDGCLVSTYIADRKTRNGASPIISAADYCYSTPSSYAATALTDVEIMAIDTRVLKDMGQRDTILLLCRNLALFSDMAQAMREKLREEFERTGLPCFSPDLPEDKILRFQPHSFEPYYLDFASRAMAELMAGRIYRAREDMRSTAIAALPPQAYPLTTFKSF